MFLEPEVWPSCFVISLLHLQWVDRNRWAQNLSLRCDASLTVRVAEVYRIKLLWQFQRSRHALLYSCWGGRQRFPVWPPLSSKNYTAITLHIKQWWDSNWVKIWVALPPKWLGGGGGAAAPPHTVHTPLGTDYCVCCVAMKTSFR